MYSSKKVSVVTITQNSAKFIDTAYKSFAYQDYHNAEWLIVDNHSTDGTLDLLLQYQSKDPRLKVFPFLEQQQPRMLFNAALKEVKGKFIAFLEPENVWVKDKISKQLGFMMRYDTSLCHTSYAFIDNLCAVLPVGCCKIEPNVNLINYHKNAQICLSTLMINTADIQKYLPIKPKDNDPDFLMYFMQKGLSSQGLDEVLSLCRLQYGPPTSPDYEPRLEKLSAKIRAKKKSVPSALRFDAYKANNIAHIKLQPSEFIDRDVYLSMNELKNFNL